MQRLFNEAEQGTPEWLESRIGYVTASNMAAVMAKGQGKTRQNYMVKMLCETLSGKPVEGYKSQKMQDGNDNEATARLAYELETGNVVTEQGFCYIPKLKLGASTDGNVDEDGDIEIKSVTPSVQVDFLTSGKISGVYIKQMQTQMFVREKRWVDFVSHSLGDAETGELPEEYKLKIVRVFRDEAMIKEILNETARFHKDLAELTKKLKQSVKG